jgi:cytosine deaminase
MLAAGVTVCLGQDDISDAYYAYGRNNMVEVAFLASHLLWMTTTEDRERLYEMITVRAAEAIGVRGHLLEVGAPANLVILDGADLLDVFRHHAAPLHVISNGRLLAGPTP